MLLVGLPTVVAVMSRMTSGPFFAGYDLQTFRRSTSGVGVVAMPQPPTLPVPLCVQPVGRARPRLGRSFGESVAAAGAEPGSEQATTITVVATAAAIAARSRARMSMRGFSER